MTQSEKKMSISYQTLIYIINLPTLRNYEKPLESAWPLFSIFCVLGGGWGARTMNCQGHPTTIFGKYLFGRRFEV